MKILAINASPRPGSNVKAALEIVLEEAKSNGADGEIINVNGLTISACQADGYCKEHDGECALNDDMQDIYKKIEESDVILFGSPVYFCDINAQAKIVIDRLYSYFMNETYSKLFADKKVHLIVSHGAAPVEMFIESLNTQMNVFGGLGFQTGEIITLGDNNVPGAVKDKEDQIEQLKALVA